MSLCADSPMTAKFRFQTVDDEKKTLYLEALEGDVMKMYKTFKVKAQFNDVGNGASKVIWGIEYEKANENAPEPDHYANFALKVSKELDARLRQAK